VGRKKPSEQGSNEGDEEMEAPSMLEAVKRHGEGLAIVLMPLLFVFAFAVHPGLLHPQMLTPEQVVLRARDNQLLAFGHVLVLFDAALIIVVALHFMKVLEKTRGAWLGFIGAVASVLGAIALGAEKGAESLTMTALFGMPNSVFAGVFPGLVAIFSHRGWMGLVWGVVLIAVGLVLQAIGLLMTDAIPRWEAALLFAVCFLGWPDGREIINLTAAVLLSVALVPYGLRVLTRGQPLAAPTRGAGPAMSPQEAHRAR
jgi:hypothetical protein